MVPSTHRISPCAAARDAAPVEREQKDDNHLDKTCGTETYSQEEYSEEEKEEHKEERTHSQERIGLDWGGRFTEGNMNAPCRARFPAFGPLPEPHWAWSGGYW